MDIPILTNMTKKMYSDKYISRYYPEFYNYLSDRYGDIPIKEKLYLYFNNLNEPHKCKVCGQYTKLDSFTKGYRVYCSSKCCNSDPDKIQLTRRNLVKKYGVENISQLDTIKNKKIDTCLRNHGVENPSQSDIVKEKRKITVFERYEVEHPSQSDIIKQKMKNTTFERYGVDHPSQSDIVKEKKKETCLRNYGVLYPSQSNEIKQKQKEAFNKSYMSEHPDIVEIKENDGERIYKCVCDKNCEGCIDKTYEIHGSLYHSRNYQGLEKCTILNPVDHKSIDTSIEKFIKDILIEFNIEYITNIRLFDNLEADIYIPTKNIAIECNGVYWHCDKIKTKKYHYEKYVTYRDNGVQLLSFWEDWIKTKPNIVRSILLSKLGIYNDKIYARKCNIVEVNNKNAKIFLEQNHIQGNTNNLIKLGLIYNDQLVSLMTFSKKRRSMMGNSMCNDGEWELVRFCNKLNTQVIGSASRLLSYFIKKYNPNSIVSFASHDISNGNLYKTLGFDKISEYEGSYWYIDSNMLRYHRYTFRKSELIKKGYDPNKSEFQIMDELKYLRIYDSGQSKYILQIKKDL